MKFLLECFLKLIVTVYVDGKKISNPICNCENLSQLVTCTAQQISSTLHPYAWVDNGTKLKSDLKKFILNTPKNQVLYLRKVKPKILKEYKISYLAIFFEALDRFLFPDYNFQKVCVLH